MVSHTLTVVEPLMESQIPDVVARQVLKLVVSVVVGQVQLVVSVVVVACLVAVDLVVEVVEVAAPQMA